MNPLFLQALGFWAFVLICVLAWFGFALSVVATFEYIVKRLKE